MPKKSRTTNRSRTNRSRTNRSRTNRSRTIKKSRTMKKPRRTHKTSSHLKNGTYNYRASSSQSEINKELENVILYLGIEERDEAYQVIEQIRTHFVNLPPEQFQQNLKILKNEYKNRNVDDVARHLYDILLLLNQNKEILNNANPLYDPKPLVPGDTLTDENLMSYFNAENDDDPKKIAFWNGMHFADSLKNGQSSIESPLLKKLMGDKLHELHEYLTTLNNRDFREAVKTLLPGYIKIYRDEASNEYDNELVANKILALLRAKITPTLATQLIQSNKYIARAAIQREARNRHTQDRIGSGGSQGYELDPYMESSPEEYDGPHRSMEFSPGSKEYDPYTAPYLQWLVNDF